MASPWLAITEFVNITGISERKARRALSRAVAGQPWRGHQLVVRRAHGAGGKSGTRYEVYLPSLPPELQQRWCDENGEPENLPPPTTTDRPADAVSPAAERDVGTEWLWRLELIKPALSLPAGSRDRGAAIREIAARTHSTPDGGRRTVSANTVRKWIAAYEAHGAAGLARRKRSDRKRRRVLISRRWDRTFDLDRETRERIASTTRRKVRSLWAAGAPGWKHIQRLGTVELVELTRQAGGGGDDARLFKACLLPRSFIEAEREYALIAIHDRDAKQFFDKHLPRVTRHRDGLQPMEMVVGDVKHLDIAFKRDDGSTCTPKMIAWQDLATNRLFTSLVILPQGRGIRKADVIASFIAMTRHPQFGMPARLYIDNGSEYNWTTFLKDALRLADRTQLIIRSLQADREASAFLRHGMGRTVVKARPYNPSAKPIEGTFGVFDIVLSMFPGSIGGDRMEKKTQNVGKVPSPYPGGPEELRADFDVALRYYHSTPQTGHLDGRSPDEAFERAVGAGWERTDIDPFALATVFGERRTPTVDRGRIAFKGAVYYHDALLALTGQRVTAIRPVVADGDRLYVIDLKGDFVCAAEREARYAFTDVAGAVEQGRRTRELKGRIKAMRRGIDRIDLADEMRAAVSFHGPTPTPPSAGIIKLSESHEAMGGELKSAPVRSKRGRLERAAEKLERQRTLIKSLNAPAGDPVEGAPGERSKKGVA